MKTRVPFDFDKLCTELGKLHKCYDINLGLGYNSVTARFDSMIQPDLQLYYNRCTVQIMNVYEWK